MKKIIGIAIVGILATSCSKNNDTAETQESNVMKEELTQETATNNEPEGKTIIAGMDCATCHKEDAKLIGPSYQDIAAKYTEGDIEMLADKIINGGSGNWGDIPMTPHAGLSKEDAKKMVAYIMTMKK